MKGSSHREGTGPARLSPSAMALTGATLWGGSILVIGTLGILFPDYGASVLALVTSIYPGYENSGGWLDLLLGTVYATVDGLVGGYVLALLYNVFVRLLHGRSAEAEDDDPSPTRQASGRQDRREDPSETAEHGID